MTDDQLLTFVRTVDLDAVRRLVDALTEAIPVLTADMVRDGRRCANYERLGDDEAAWSVARPWIVAAARLNG